MELKAGKTIGLLGRNGVGKSTTLKSIMGLVSVKKGSIKLDGQELVGRKPHQISRLGVGYIPEDRRIFPTLTVRENLVIARRSNKESDRIWEIDDIYYHFPRLKDREKAKGGNLSGGEQQMLAIGRTLMSNPKILLLDEPTEGLAPSIRRKVVEMIKAMQDKKITILLVEQSIDLVIEAANNVYVMSKGEIVYKGTGRDLMDRADIRQKYLEV